MAPLTCRTHKGIEASPSAVTDKKNIRNGEEKSWPMEAGCSRLPVEVARIVALWCPVDRLGRCPALAGPSWPGQTVNKFEHQVFRFGTSLIKSLVETH